MELLVVGLLGAVLFLGPEDIEGYLQSNELKEQEQVVETVQPNSAELRTLSKQYDPLEPGSIYVEPEIDSVLVNREQTQVDETSKVDQAAAKLQQMTQPIANWYEDIKKANKARADRHSFVRNRNAF